MFQLYLLTVLTNVLAGLALSSGFLSRKLVRFSDYTEFMMNKAYRIIVGGLTLIVAVINLFSNHTGDVAVLGELFPTLTGLVAGVLLIIEFWSEHKESEEGKSPDAVERIQNFSKPYLTIIGLLTVLVGILHAVIPTVAPF